MLISTVDGLACAFPKLILCSYPQVLAHIDIKVNAFFFHGFKK